MATSKQSISARLIRGMTLIELMVGLVIVGMGMTIAIPSFQGMLARNTMATQVNEFLLSLNRARSEASKIGSVVSVQALSSDSANEYGSGWCIVRGNGDCTGGVFMQAAGLTANNSLNLVDDGGATAIRFNAMGGLVGGSAIDVDLCSADLTGRRIHISLVGRSHSHKIDDVNVTRRPVCE
jgi:type IV fimbrial biogenesis protein FimT